MKQVSHLLRPGDNKRSELAGTFMALKSWVTEQDLESQVSLEIAVKAFNLFEDTYKKVLCSLCER